jgi:hypothetical protein
VLTFAGPAYGREYVDFEFQSAKWARLTKEEQVAMCRALAVDAERHGYDAIGRQWRQLAEEIAAAT